MQSTLFPDSWNALEIAKLLVGILTPFSVAVIGWIISRNLKRLDLAQWKNQKLIEKRISVYDSVAPQLNLLLCFFTWVGNWKSISPETAIKTKRDLDRAMSVYRYLFDDEVYVLYESFIRTLFETYTGAGQDARIKSLIRCNDGDRTACDYPWKDEWSTRFSAPGKVASKDEIRDIYHELMSELTCSFGVSHDNK